jgi:hypothetical protein
MSWRPSRPSPHSGALMSRHSSEVDGEDGDLGGSESDDDAETTKTVTTAKGSYVSRRGRDRGEKLPQQCHACLGAGGLNKKLHGSTSTTSASAQCGAAIGNCVV